MRPTLLVFLFTVACTTPFDDTTSTTGCDNQDACDITSAKRGLDGRHVHSRGSKTFNSGGSEYSLVYYDYGDGTDSTYASFVYDGEDYPLDVVFFDDDDELFDYEDYGCDPFWDNCAWPAYDLAIIDDDDFIDWVYSTDTWYTVDLQYYYDNDYDFRRADRAALHRQSSSSSPR